jgi:CRISPR-associated exonuclease Cas4
MSIVPTQIDTSTFLRVNEIKNWLYCARISYYALCLRLDRETGLSQAGIDAETETKRLMTRRRHALHAVVDGQRHFDVALYEANLRLTGKLDELVETADGVYLIDYKDTVRDYGYWRAQMCAYRRCARATLGQPVLGCFVYAIPERRYIEVKLTRRDEQQLDNILTALAVLLKSEVCPQPTSQVGKCRTCQYLRFCNDVF